MDLNRFDEARAVLRQLSDQGLDFAGARRISYLLAFIQNDAATMERDLSASIGPSETNAAFGWRGHTLAATGNPTAAHEQFSKGVQLATQGNFPEVAAQLTLEDAESHAVVGQCVDTRREAAAGLALSRDMVTLEHAAHVLAVCGSTAEAMTLSNELARRFPESTLITHLSLPVIAASAALARGEAARAVEILEPVRPYDHAGSADFWPLYLRGRAYLLLKDGRRAAAEFRGILDHRGEVPASPLYGLAHVGLARAASLLKDTDTARREYEQFFKVWNDGDPSLPVMKEARAEHASL
jgi:tetratricopeptide (TPR) repeat protein